MILLTSMSPSNIISFIVELHLTVSIKGVFNALYTLLANVYLASSASEGYHSPANHGSNGPYNLKMVFHPFPGIV